MTPELLARLAEAKRERRLAVLATRLPDGLQVLLGQDEEAPAADPAVPLPDGLLAAVAAAAADERSRQLCLGTETWFLHVQVPQPRLLVIGAVHVAQALAPLATALGFGVTVIDPRGAFATKARFPDVALSGDWPDEALAALRPDRRTAVLTLTHDPKLDDPALDQALRSEAFYIGSLGSRKTHASRLERLAALGHDAASLARIRGPVGLALGAVTAPEIALSVLAELVAVRRGAAIAARA